MHSEWLTTDARSPVRKNLRQMNTDPDGAGGRCRLTVAGCRWAVDGRRLPLGVAKFVRTSRSERRAVAPLREESVPGNRLPVDPVKGFAQRDAVRSDARERIDLRLIRMEAEGRRPERPRARPSPVPSGGRRTHDATAPRFTASLRVSAPPREERSGIGPILKYLDLTNSGNRATRRHENAQKRRLVFRALRASLRQVV